MFSGRRFKKGSSLKLVCGVGAEIGGGPCGVGAAAFPLSGGSLRVAGAEIYDHCCSSLMDARGEARIGAGSI